MTTKSKSSFIEAQPAHLQEVIFKAREAQLIEVYKGVAFATPAYLAYILKTETAHLDHLGFARDVQKRKQVMQNAAIAKAVSDAKLETEKVKPEGYSVNLTIEILMDRYTKS